MTPSSNNRTKYDAVIIGAGPNGLTAATLLAQSGHKVVVLERRSVAGGLASGTEFHPGYHSPGLLHDTSGMLPEAVERLSLWKYGLRRTSNAPIVFAATREGRGLLLDPDSDDIVRELNANGASDAESYARFRAFVSRIKPLARRFFTNLPPDVMTSDRMDWLAVISRGLAFRRLGKTDMMEVLRLGPMCVADWLDEQFGSTLLKATMAAPALRGYWGGPHSPGTNGALLRYEVLAGGAVVGGPQAVVGALLKASEAAGVEVITSKSVSGISVNGGAVSSVICKDGDQFRSKLVVSSCDPKTTFLGLVGDTILAPSFMQDIRSYRMRGITAVVNLALKRPLQFRCRPDHIVEFARTGQSLVELEQVFDAVKYGRFVDEPALEIYVPSLANASSAPEGHASVAILARGIPYDHNGGWGEDAREKLGDAIVNTLSSYADNLDSSIVAREVLTPVDIKDRYSVTGGHVYHGEHGLDQLLVRPALQCARYSTPITGLYLCGSGSHPGGGLTCAPGFIAARTIMNNRRRS